MDFITAVLNPTFLTILALIIGFCLSTTWLLVLVWLFIDSKKRYKNKTVSLILTLFILPFNIPGLVFYMIIRPEGEEEHVFYLNENEATGLKGINVPIVNFKGEDGFKLSLNLNIGNSHNHEASTMDVNVDFKSKDKRMVEVDESEIVETKKDESLDNVKPTIPPVATKAKNLAKKAKDKFSKVFGSIKSYGDQIEDVEDESESEKS